MAIFSALLALCEGGFPSQRSVTRNFDDFFLSEPEQTVKQTVETLVIWDTIALIMASMWYFITPMIIHIHINFDNHARVIYPGQGRVGVVIINLKNKNTF